MPTPANCHEDPFDSLRRGLKEHFSRDRSNDYDQVKVLLIIWKNGANGFRTEAESLGTVFSQDFRYSVELFEIPQRSSHLALDQKINQFIGQAPDSERTLFIIHYGGHGYENDEDSSLYAGNRGCIWAATNTRKLHAGNSLNWSEIQLKLRYVPTAKVLLLLDCCFAGTAARNNNRVIPDNVEVLLSSSMREETPGPGPRSFTQKLTKELRDIARGDRAVRVEDLYHRLLERRRDLFTTPIHCPLHNWPSIRLSPLSTSTANANMERSSLIGVPVLLTVKTKAPFDYHQSQDLLAWIKKDTPRGILDIEVTMMDEDCNPNSLYFKNADVPGYSTPSHLGSDNGTMRSVQIRQSQANPETWTINPQIPGQLISSLLAPKSPEPGPSLWVNLASDYLRYMHLDLSSVMNTNPSVPCPDVAHLHFWFNQGNDCLSLTSVPNTIRWRLLILMEFLHELFIICKRHMSRKGSTPTGYSIDRSFAESLKLFKTALDSLPVGIRSGHSQRDLVRCL